MRTVYKIPKFIAILVLIGICIELYPYIIINSDADILTQAECYAMTKSTLMELTGVDLYLILNNIRWLFVLPVAILSRDMLEIKVWQAIVIVFALFLQITFGVIAIQGLEDFFSTIGLPAITMTGQYVYGTAPLTILLAFVLAKIMKKSIWRMLDFISPLWLINLVFVRLACFTAGCCEVEACNLVGIELVLPAQLLEVLLNLILLQIIFNIERNRAKGKNTCIKEGNAFFIALGGHAVFRFLIDFMRDVPDLFLGMTFAQVYSLVCIVISIAILVKLNRITKVGN